jgi:hypothetical protein
LLVLICALCHFADDAIYGSAEWGLGAHDEDDKLVIPDVPVIAPVDPVEPVTPADTLEESSEGLNVATKAFMFGIIVAAIAFYVRLSRRKGTMEDVGYEKNLA